MLPLKFLKRYGRAAAIGLVECTFVARFAPLHGLARIAMTRRIRVLAPHFEPDLYLRQLLSARRRRLAAADPILHYLLVGWREFRSPNLRFDPRFFMNDVAAGSKPREPLLQLLSMAGRDSLPQNEVEACAPPPRSVGSTSGKKALIFHHARGGGSSKFLAIFENDLRRRGVEPIRLRLMPRSDRLLIWPGADGEAAKVFDLVEQADALVDEARRASIDTIVVSHIVDFNARRIFGLLSDLSSKLEASLCVILHDYFCLCPRVNLIKSDGTPCGLPPSSACVPCVATGGSEIGSADPAAWRGNFLSFIDKADRIVVPSDDVRRRVGRFTTKPMEIWWPEPEENYPPLASPRLRPDQKLSIAVLGSLNHVKGSKVVLDLMQYANKVRAPIEVSVFGEADIARKLKQAGVHIRGRYRDGDLSDMLAAEPPHLVLLPAIWPETWSFVLTTALRCGLPVMAFAHGAQSERLRRLGREDLLLPTNWCEHPEKILTRLVAFRRACVIQAA